MERTLDRIEDLIIGMTDKFREVEAKQAMIRKEGLKQQGIEQDILVAYVQAWIIRLTPSKWKGQVALAFSL